MTPFYQALEAAQQTWPGRTLDESAYADLEQKKGRINAVSLYGTGGRFFVGKVHDDLRRKADAKVASILLAAAYRDGRMGGWADGG